MPTNWRKIYALKKQAEQKLVKEMPTLENRSGIYILIRDDESGLRFGYVGQAKELKTRLIGHLLSYSQRIDISLKKRGFYDKEKRPYGWVLAIQYCDESELNEREQAYIKDCAEKGIQLYNKTAGSQGQGKIGINDGQTTKGYRDGIKQGYANCLKDINEYFDKYLDYVIKKDLFVFKKNGELKEIYRKKFVEFEKLLKGEHDEQ